MVEVNVASGLAWIEVENCFFFWLMFIGPAVRVPKWHLRDRPTERHPVGGCRHEKRVREPSALPCPCGHEH